MSAIQIYHRVEDTQLDQIAAISMDGTPKTKSNKTWKEMERGNNEIAQDGVESSAFLLRGGGWLAARSIFDDAIKSIERCRCYQNYRKLIAKHALYLPLR